MASSRFGRSASSAGFTPSPVSRDVGELPSKLFFRIGEVASLVGVEPHVLRYWEREFRSIRPTKSAKGQRVYSRRDVENLLRVRDLLYRDGFTIAGAKKRLQRGGVEAELSSAQTPTAPFPAIEQGEEAPLLAPAPNAAEVEVGGSAEPESGPRAHGEPGLPIRSLALETQLSSGSPVVVVNRGSRKKLTALRAEVTAFLDELDSDPDEQPQPLPSHRA